MLKFGIINITAMLVAGLLQYVNAGWWSYVILTVTYISLLFYGSYYIGSGFYLKAVCKGNRDKKQIAITFDDGPDSEITPQVLDLLQKHNVKASFFCIGNHIEGNEELLERMNAEGHLLGNHSYSHAPLFDLYRTARMTEDLQMTAEKIKRVTGKRVKLFRPPYGVTNPMVKRAVKALNYTVVGWNVRSLDAVATDPAKVMKRLRRLLKPGAIILFHDSKQIIVPILTEFLVYVEQEGYHIVPLDNLTGIKPYE